ncbi:MAG: acyl carrier protein [Burkholderiales bacterium]|nr:acyl carrier protein [Burkholderiales bacterium]
MQQEDITKLLAAAILELRPSLEGRPLGPSDSLEALGLDSMERADIVMLVLEHMNLRIPLVQTFGPRNIGELARLLSEKSAA